MLLAIPLVRKQGSYEQDFEDAQSYLTLHTFCNAFRKINVKAPGTGESMQASGGGIKSKTVLLL